MKRWKWMRCLRATSALAKNRSISIDLPRPTSPTRYRPFGAPSGASGTGTFRRSNRSNRPPECRLNAAGSYPRNASHKVCNLLAAWSWDGSGASSPPATIAR